MREQFTDAVDETIDLENKLLELNESEETKALIDKKIAWGTLTDQVIELAESGDRARALSVMRTDVRPLSTEIMAEFQAAAQKREEIIKKAGDDIIANGETTFAISGIIAGLVFILAIITAIFITRAITRPIKSLDKPNELVASGDLSGDSLEIKTADEVQWSVVCLLRQRMRWSYKIRIY